MNPITCELVGVSGHFFTVDVLGTEVRFRRKDGTPSAGEGQWRVVIASLDAVNAAHGGEPPARKRKVKEADPPLVTLEGLTGADGVVEKLEEMCTRGEPGPLVSPEALRRPNGPPPAGCVAGFGLLVPETLWPGPADEDLEGDAPADEAEDTSPAQVQAAEDTSTMTSLTAAQFTALCECVDGLTDLLQGIRDVLGAAALTRARRELAKPRG